MTITGLFLVIILIHFLADFALQTHEQASRKGDGKSIWNKWLFYHVGVYTLVWGVVYWILPYGGHTIFGNLIFMFLIGVPHYVVDWITSRINKQFFASGDLHNGFVGVGFDQVFHYIFLWSVLYNTVPLI